MSTHSNQDIRIPQDQQIYISRGSNASLEKIFSKNEVSSFAQISGDVNDIHLNENQVNTALYEKYGVTGTVLVHGLLVASLISAVAGTKLPGKDSIYLKQNLDFSKPVYAGDICEVKVKLTRVIRKNLFAFDTTIYNKSRNWIAITGDSVVMHPTVQGGKNPLDVLSFWFEDNSILDTIREKINNNEWFVDSLDPSISSNDRYIKKLNNASNVPELEFPAGFGRWFSGSKQLDQFTEMHFKSTSEILANSEMALDQWIHRLFPDHPELGLLSAVILFDQFSRNIYRGTPMAFQNDNLALKLSKRAIFDEREKYYDALKFPILKSWLLFPFEHSESIEDQNTCVKEFNLLVEEAKTLGVDSKIQESFLMYAEKHRDVIKAFGRFPHRNAILGRESSQEEIEHLNTHGGF